MDPSHVVLHIALCASIARQKPEASIPLQVQLSDRLDIVRFNRTFAVDRGYDDLKVVEFDGPPGIYRIDVNAKRYGCSASAFVDLIPDQDRTMDATLAENPPPPAVPLLFQGKAPESFLYVKPSFVLIPKSVACGKPIQSEIPSQESIENDGDSYYATMSVDRSAPPATLAMRLQTPTHLYHYVRIPIPYPPPPSGWPGDIGFDVTQDMVDEVATQPTGALLCLKLWETTAH